jgi:hypothetical protein
VAAPKDMSTIHLIAMAACSSLTDSRKCLLQICL